MLGKKSSLDKRKLIPNRMAELQSGPAKAKDARSNVKPKVEPLEIDEEGRSGVIQSIKEKGDASHEKIPHSPSSTAVKGKRKASTFLDEMLGKRKRKG